MCCQAMRTWCVCVCAITELERMYSMGYWLRGGNAFGTLRCVHSGHLHRRACVCLCVPAGCGTPWHTALGTLTPLALRVELHTSVSACVTGSEFLLHCTVPVWLLNPATAAAAADARLLPLHRYIITEACVCVWLRFLLWVWSTSHNTLCRMSYG